MRRTPEGVGSAVEFTNRFVTPPRPRHTFNTSKTQDDFRPLAAGPRPDQEKIMLRRVSRVTACLLFVSALALHAAAQVNNASMTGLITDTAGAVVPNASVTLKNKATNVETTATTDSSGYYTFASVPVGAYTV